MLSLYYAILSFFVLASSSAILASLVGMFGFIAAKIRDIKKQRDIYRFIRRNSFACDVDSLPTTQQLAASLKLSHTQTYRLCSEAKSIRLATIQGEDRWDILRKPAPYGLNNSQAHAFY